jgi:hypothetical protein
MNIPSFLICACTAVALSATAQTYPNQTPSAGVTTQTQPAYINNAQTNGFGTGGMTYSNRLGQVFSADDLASKLQSLRSSLDETLPALQAFNEQFSNSVAASSQQGVSGALSGIVSDVLHRNQPAGQNSTATTQSSFNTSNVLAVLRNLLNKNSSTGTTATPANAQDLANLQRDLQPVLADLQRLNVGPSVNPTTTPNPTGNLPEQNYPNGTLTPTGR